MSADSQPNSSTDANQYIDVETGHRNLLGLNKTFITTILILWSCFQLWYASPLPFVFELTINEDQAKAVHLAFASFLAYSLFPLFDRDKNRLPLYDLLLAALATGTILYLLIFRDELTSVSRIGLPTTLDTMVAWTGLALLLEAARRSLGLPLVVVSVVFLSFTLGGQYMPEVISHPGASMGKIASHQWLSTEGVFGVALGVSTTFVFLFVLLGSFLDRAGAGNYLIKVSFSLLGHMRGGPAKAAVVASGLSGIISGSSIANVVTTGTFTIPLMKRVGFPGTKAGAIEVAASTNGQLTPPIMGAAAFLMVEYVGISYLEVIKHAILPSLISYIALMYIVHLEAIKLNMQGIERTHKPTLAQRMLSWVTNIVILLVLGVGVYYGSVVAESVFGDYASLSLSVVIIGMYVWLVKLASTYPDLSEDDGSIELSHLPEVRPTVLSGLYFSVPIIVLLWALAVQQYSPQTSAFYAVACLILVVFTHRPLKAWFRAEHNLTGMFIHGWHDFVDGLISGARNMVGIGIATATAGIIVGTVTQTGLGQMMTAFVEFVSGGSLILILFFTAVICIVLGMGLPTTANYIVVSTLMAPVIVSLGAENGLVVPLIAVHLFVFYFGILADDTPPVGLAAFAAAAISGDDPIKTGIQGFAYDIRTAILPFMFIFNTQLLLIGIESVWGLLLTIFSAVTAILVFAAATQGYWLTRTKWWETIGLLVVSFTLFVPGYWWDKVYPPTTNTPVSELVAEVESISDGDFIQFRVQGENLEGREIDKTISLQLNSKETVADARLSDMGMMLVAGDNRDELLVDNVVFGSQADKLGLEYGWKITAVVRKVDRLPAELMFIPALLLLFIMGWMQHRRRNADEGVLDVA
jgi:TRAP transporter 4TM/12TM fusion protein